MRLTTALRGKINGSVIQHNFSSSSASFRSQIFLRKPLDAYHPTFVRRASSKSKPPASHPEEPAPVANQAPSVFARAQQAAGDAAARFAKGASESLQWAASSKARVAASQAASSLARTASGTADYVSKAPAIKAAAASTANAASWFARFVGRAAHQAGAGVVEAAHATIWSLLGRAAGFAIILVMAGGFAYGVGSSLPKALAGSIVWGSRGTGDPNAPGMAQRASEASAAAASTAKQAWTRTKDLMNGRNTTATEAAPAPDIDRAADTPPGAAAGGLRQTIHQRWDAAKQATKSALDAVASRESSGGN